MAEGFVLIHSRDHRVLLFDLSIAWNPMRWARVDASKAHRCCVTYDFDEEIFGETLENVHGFDQIEGVHVFLHYEQK